MYRYVCAHTDLQCALSHPLLPQVPAVGQAVLDLKLRICAQCARVISGQDGVTSDSITEVSEHHVRVM